MEKNSNGFEPMEDKKGLLSKLFSWCLSITRMDESKLQEREKKGVYGFVTKIVVIFFVGLFLIKTGFGLVQLASSAPEIINNVTQVANESKRETVQSSATTNIKQNVSTPTPKADEIDDAVMKIYHEDIIKAAFEFVWNNVGEDVEPVEIAKMWHDEMRPMIDSNDNTVLKTNWIKTNISQHDAEIYSFNDCYVNITLFLREFYVTPEAKRIAKLIEQAADNITDYKQVSNVVESIESIASHLEMNPVDLAYTWQARLIPMLSLDKATTAERVNWYIHPWSEFEFELKEETPPELYIQNLYLITVIYIREKGHDRHNL